MRAPLLLVLLLIIGGSAFATPPMPPRPKPLNPAFGAATSFANDLTYTQKLSRSLKLGLLFRPSPAEARKVPENYRYDIREYGQRFDYAPLRSGFGNEYVTLASDGSFPVIPDPSRVDRGIVALVVPNRGKEAGALHAILFNRDGTVWRDPLVPKDATAGVLRFIDDEASWDVIVPYGGGTIIVRRFEPEDRSF